MLAVLNAVYAKVLASLVGIYVPWTPDNGVTYPVSYFTDLAPTNAPFPRLVGSVVPNAGSQSKYSGGMAFEPISFRFTAYSNVSQAACVGNIESVMAAFDDVLLTLSVGHMTNTVRTGQPVPVLDPDRDSTGKDIWRASVQYLWTISPR